MFVSDGSDHGRKAIGLKKDNRSWNETGSEKRDIAIVAGILVVEDR